MHAHERADGFGPPRSQEELLTEVARTLESAGVSGDIIGKVEATLKANGGGAPTTSVSESKLAMSENALHILEQRYLRRDAEGNTVETPEELFRRVSRAIALGE